MDAVSSRRRLDAIPPSEAPLLDAARARLCNYAYRADRYDETRPLIDPRLLLELVAQMDPSEAVRLVFERAARAWRFDIETQRMSAGKPRARAALVASLKVIAPNAQFKVLDNATARPAWSVELKPEAYEMLSEEATRIWLPPAPRIVPNLSLALAAARAFGVTSAAFTLKPVELSQAHRAILETGRFRARAKSARSPAEYAAIEVMSLWLEAGRGVGLTITIGADEALSGEALNTIAAAMTGRAGRAPFGAPQVDLRLAVPCGALPSLRFWPTPSDLALFEISTPDVGDESGTIALGVDAAGDVLRLASRDRMMHAAVWGASGAGKTTFLTNCILEDIAKGQGVMLVDVHGDMADRVVTLIPEHRKRDLVLFDAGSAELAWRLDLLTTPGVNPLLERSRLANLFIGFFRQLYAAIPESMGPAFELYYVNAFKLLMSAREDEDRTLLKFDDVFLDEAFRYELLRGCDDPKVRQFWEDCACNVTGENNLANIAPYITNKMAQFSQNPLTAAAIGGDKPRLDLRAAMDAKKIVIVRLPKGVIGEYDARFLGAVFLMVLLEAAMSRVNIAEEDRVPFRVYIDEFADLATATAARMLAEVRKYQLSLVLSCQSLSQLNGDKFNPAAVGEAMLANCGTFILFRMSRRDAEAMSGAIDGVSPRELTQLGVGDIIARRLVHGVPREAERLQGLPPASAITAYDNG